VDQGGMRDVGSLVVRRAGRLVETGDQTRPYQLLDAAGAEVEPVSLFLRDMLASGRSVTSLRSYGNALLRWFRFLWAVKVAWERAGRQEAADFMLWLSTTRKPARRRRPDAPTPGSINPITGKPYPGETYAVRTVRHNRAAIRTFYQFHVEVGGPPLRNPFPPARSAGRGPYAHHNPLEPLLPHRRAAYQPKLPRQLPRSIPDRLFDELFAAMGCNRDRAILAFYICTGARASELLGATRGGVNIGDQLIAVERKGTRALQWLPASADAFVWLRLYQHDLDRLDPQLPGGLADPLWWTLRRPARPLTYDAFRAVLRRANQQLGTNWSLHDLRHTAAYRMVDDPHMRLTDVQWVLGHAQLATTQIYWEPRQEDVIQRVRQHHAQLAAGPPSMATASGAAPAPRPGPAEGYRPEVWEALFGRLPQ
jgi:site-specific recombinase XerD